MAELRVPIDPMNPGQFFACCGLLSLAYRTHGQVTSRFVRGASPRRAEFLIEDFPVPLPDLLRSLRDASVERHRESGEPEDNPEESVWPLAVTIAGDEICLDWWLDEFRQKAVSLKCWAGQVRSLGLLQGLLQLIDPAWTAEELFTARRMTKLKFGVDPRSAWNALDFGYSPNEHNRDAATFPAVEVLAAFGLQWYRPVLEQRKFGYFLWLESLPALVSRLAAVAAWEGLEADGYRSSIEKRGSYKFFALAQAGARSQRAMARRRA